MYFISHIYTFTIYLLVMRIDVCIEHYSAVDERHFKLLRDAVRQNGALKATSSNYLVDFDRFFQRCSDKATH